MKMYDVRYITSQLIIEAFEVCVKNEKCKVGLCCVSCQQVRYLTDAIKNLGIKYEPFYIERIITNSHEIIVRFCNGSTLNVFSVQETARGKRFHHLIVDESVDDNIQATILKRLVAEYKPYELDKYDAYEDLFEFAESELQTPLLQWQRDMLTVLCSGGTYITGRIVGKKLITDIYIKWKDQNSESPECCPCEYTYDQIMSGIKED